jgi:hypothetical protein
MQLSVSGDPMTPGDKIWSDAVIAAGRWSNIDEMDHEFLRRFALIIIRLINDSHGIPPDEEDEVEWRG